MALLEMTKIRLAVYGADTAEILETLQRVGAVEFTPVADRRLRSKEQTPSPDIHRQSARVDFAVDFLSEFAEKKKGLKAMVEGEAESVTAEEIEYVVRNFYADEVVEKAQNLQKELNDLRKKEKELRKERERLLPWKGVPLPVRDPIKTERTETFWLARSGQIRETKAHKSLHDRLKEKDIVSAIMVVDDDRVLLTVEATRSAESLRAAKSLGYERVSLQARRGTPEEELERISRRLRKLAGLIAEKERLAEALAREHLRALKITADHLLWQKERSDAAAAAGKTATCAVFDAWCPKSALNRLREELKKVSERFSLVETEPARGETPPVEIANRGPVRPFEA
ncbi:MAG TPA: hypothetical protein ENJ77_00835, partial [Candidatus Moranbacteria bacterium]|nr:hypothetical protein [Candidatus Moranbacteria bacterium]